MMGSARARVSDWQLWTLCLHCRQHGRKLDPQHRILRLSSRWALLQSAGVPLPGFEIVIISGLTEQQHVSTGQVCMSWRLHLPECTKSSKPTLPRIPCSSTQLSQAEPWEITKPEALCLRCLVPLTSGALALELAYGIHVLGLVVSCCNPEVKVVGT